MTVYIEYVIIDNFVLTYVIGLLSYRALKTSRSGWRNLISSILATICAVLYPLFSLHFYLLLVIKLLLGCGLSFILFYKKSKLLISSAVFFGITFLLGGVLLGVGYAVYGDAKKALTMPVTNFSMGAVLFLAVVIYILLKKLLIRFHKNRDAKSGIYRIEMEVLDKQLGAQGFCDTGNRIFDEKTGLPIAVVSFTLASQILSSEALIKLLSGRGEESYEGARYTECRPYGSKPQKLWLIKPQKFLLYFDRDKNINIDIMLGLSVHSFSDAADYGLIFGTAVLTKIP